MVMDGDSDGDYDGDTNDGDAMDLRSVKIVKIIIMGYYSDLLQVFPADFVI